MKKTLFAFMFSGALVLPVSAYSAVTMPAMSIGQNEIVEHGGGCRKSSPPGKCCHMEKKTGKVHCH